MSLAPGRNAPRRHSEQYGVGGRLSAGSDNGSGIERRVDRSRSRSASQRGADAHSRRGSIPRWLIVAVPGLAIALSFFATLYLLEPQLPITPAAAALVRANISDTRSLLAAIKAAGLAGSANVKGEIDEVARRDDSEVTISGWAAEVGNSAAPLTILVFVAGKETLAMRTSGRHPDVVSLLGASDAPDATNAAFQGIATCRRGQNLLVVAVTDRNAYGYFGTRDCP